MPQYHLPEFDAITERLLKGLDEVLENFRDLKATLDSCNSPESVVDGYEARRLLRELPDDAVIS